jgi:hypothetical protein
VKQYAAQKEISLTGVAVKLLLQLCAVEGQIHTSHLTEIIKEKKYLQSSWKLWTFVNGVKHMSSRHSKPTKDGVSSMRMCGFFSCS